MTHPVEGSKLDSYVADTILLVITETTCSNCRHVAESSQLFTIFRPLASEKLKSFRQEVQFEALINWSLPRGTSTLRKTTFCCAKCFESYRLDDNSLPPLEIDHSPSAMARFNESLKRLERQKHSARPPVHDRRKRQPTSTGVALSLDDFIKD